MLGEHDVVVAGGMENMSQAPFYLEQARYGYKFGNGALIDAISKDGLIDVYHNYPMGVAAELCATECNISREDQDAFAIESYTRSANAWKAGKFDAEIVPVIIPQKKGDPIVVNHDEEYKNVKFDKIPGLNPVFKKDGTVTAANASTINDGASALVLMSKQKMEALGLKPLAKIISFSDAEQAPEWFTTTPSITIPKALAKIGKTVADVDFFEINEAFSVVSIANNRAMNLDASKVNVNGGAVSLGHPLGSSGSRILVTLVHVLHQNNGKIGVAGLCNGGGGATAVVIEKC
jgi:acetyl-CoA C-acetyltransferase